MNERQSAKIIMKKSGNSRFSTNPPKKRSPEFEGVRYNG